MVISLENGIGAVDEQRLVGDGQALEIAAVQFHAVSRPGLAESRRRHRLHRALRYFAIARECVIAIKYQDVVAKFLKTVAFDGGGNLQPWRGGPAYSKLFESIQINSPGNGRVHAVR